MQESEKWKWSRSVVSNPQRPHGLQPSRLLRPWNFPGKSTGVGCHCLLLHVLVALTFVNCLELAEMNWSLMGKAYYECNGFWYLLFLRTHFCSLHFHPMNFCAVLLSSCITSSPLSYLHILNTFPLSFVCLFFYLPPCLWKLSFTLLDKISLSSRQV